MTEKDDSAEVTVKTSGCLYMLAVITFFWALIFGVTIGGKHHGVECTCDHGVVVQ